MPAALPTGRALTHLVTFHLLQPPYRPALIDELHTRRFLESATNILLIGPPETGKTHMSVGLATATVQAGYRNYFVTAADLAASNEGMFWSFD